LSESEGPLLYPYELWTTRLLANHAREHGLAEGRLAHLAQGTVCKILAQEEVIIK
jgi:hypothetical protein